jgi:hypothetical protein
MAAPVLLGVIPRGDGTREDIRVDVAGDDDATLELACEVVEEALDVTLAPARTGRRVSGVVLLEPCLELFLLEDDAP